MIYTRRGAVAYKPRGVSENVSDVNMLKTYLLFTLPTHFWIFFSIILLSSLGTCFFIVFTLDLFIRSLFV